MDRRRETQADVEARHAWQRVVDAHKSGEVRSLDVKHWLGVSHAKAHLMLAGNIRPDNDHIFAAERGLLQLRKNRAAHKAKMDASLRQFRERGGK